MKTAPVLPLAIRGKVASRKIGYAFPTTPEGRLMYAVIDRTILDLGSKPQRQSALRYLRGGMYHAGLAGVNADWIRDILVRCKVCSRLQLMEHKGETQ